MIHNSLQTYYEEQLHKGHPGIKTTKQRASEHVYWNKMYEYLDISEMCPMQRIETTNKKN